MSISPDGQWLVWNVFPGLGSPLALLSATNPAQEPLEIDNGGFCGIGCSGGDSGATWSPDGSRLLFTRSAPADDQSNSPGVWVMDRDGTNKLRLVASDTASDARWSPDGTQVSYEDNGQVYVVSASNATPPQAAAQEFPVSRGLTPKSPDGLKSLSVQCCFAADGGSSEIFNSNADGSDPQQLTFITSSCQDPSWICTGGGPGARFVPSQLQWQPTPTPDATPPTCAVSAPSSEGGQSTVTASFEDYGSGLASIKVTSADGANVTVPSFENATADPVEVQATNIDGEDGQVTLKAKDIAGNSVKCALSVSPPLGTQTMGGGQDSNTDGVAEAFRTQASATSTVDSLSVYVDARSKATTLVVVIYADHGSNHPGSLLAQGVLGNPVASAWNSISVPATQISADTKYWIAILSPLGDGVLRFRDSCCGISGGSPSETSTQTTLSILPPTWAKGTRYKNDGPIAAWAG